MKRATFAFALLFVVLVGLPAHAADNEFTSLVDALRSHYKLPAPEYPLRGVFVSSMMAMTGHSNSAEAKGIDVATFENVNLGRLDPVDFENTVSGNLPPNWRPFVRVFSRRDHEITLVYMDTASTSKPMRLFVVSAEKNELTIVRTRVSHDDTNAWVGNPSGMAQKQSK